MADRHALQRAFGSGACGTVRRGTPHCLSPRPAGS